MKTNNIITARVSCVQKNQFTLLPCGEDKAVNSDVDLTSESDIATFTDLYNDIKDNQHDGVVELNRGYKFCEGTDDDFKEGITLDKLTINGNDYKIDADGHSRIFKIMSGPVVLNNIKF